MNYVPVWMIITKVDKRGMQLWLFPTKLPKVMVWWSHADCITHSYNSTQLYILYTEYFFHSPVNALMSSEKSSFIYHLSIDASVLNHHETDKANLPSQKWHKSPKQKVRYAKTKKWARNDLRNPEFITLLISLIAGIHSL